MGSARVAELGEPSGVQGAALKHAEGIIKKQKEAFGKWTLGNCEELEQADLKHDGKKPCGIQKKLKILFPSITELLEREQACKNSLGKRGMFLLNLCNSSQKLYYFPFKIYVSIFYLSLSVKFTKLFDIFMGQSKKNLKMNSKPCLCQYFISVTQADFFGSRQLKNSLALLKQHHHLSTSWQHSVFSKVKEYLSVGLTIHMQLLVEISVHTFNTFRQFFPIHKIIYITINYTI